MCSSDLDRVTQFLELGEHPEGGESVNEIRPADTWDRAAGNYRTAQRLEACQLGTEVGASLPEVVDALPSGIEDVVED